MALSLTLPRLLLIADEAAAFKTCSSISRFMICDTRCCGAYNKSANEKSCHLSYSRRGFTGTPSSGLRAASAPAPPRSRLSISLIYTRFYTSSLIFSRATSLAAPCRWYWYMAAETFSSRHSTRPLILLADIDMNDFALGVFHFEFPAWWLAKYIIYIL